MLERSAAGRRVAVVRARQQIETLGDDIEQPGTARAIELLDEVLVHLPA